MLKKHIALFRKRKSVKKNNNYNRHKKEYGQVFSGAKIAELLVSLLPESFCPETVCDPMVGVGDLLVPILGKYNPKKIVGIDIDEKVISQCKTNVPQAEIINGDSFDRKTVTNVAGWDLIITNPPYIRYQLLNGENGDIPSASKVRSNLMTYIEVAEYLTEGEKSILLDVGKNYSGLSDLSVPSWILCASMLSRNGYMALVVPETWLSRDYALPIQYMLLKMFELDYVVKNVDASWFNDASVRTCLVIAHRREIKELSSPISEKTFLIEMTEEIAGKKSLVEKLSYKGRRASKALNLLLAEQTDYSCDGFRCNLVRTSTLFSGFYNQVKNCNWINDVYALQDEIVNLPSELHSMFYGNHTLKFQTIEQMGWNIGQGLRTGANQFFYCDILSSTEEGYIVQTNDWYGREISVDTNLIYRTIQKRSDIDENVVRYENLHKGIIYIQNQVLPEDFKRSSDTVKETNKEIGKDLAKYISEANKYILPSGKTFRVMSAVKTNIKKDQNGYLRFWYMLPKLQPRHLPDICIQRVCGKTVESLFVKQMPNEPIVVDANFTTLWIDDEEQRYILFALLNSLWFTCYTELIATVMGGGALKLEATHIKKIMFPTFEDNQSKTLFDLGKELVKGNKNKERIVDEIDEVVFGALHVDNTVCLKIKELVERKRKERGV